MLTRSQIRNASTGTFYSRGVEIHKSPERFVGFYIEEDEKKVGVDVIHALVRGSGRNVYETQCKVNWSAGVIQKYRCECLAAQTYPGPCKHCVATLLEYVDVKTATGDDLDGLELGGRRITKGRGGANMTGGRGLGGTNAGVLDRGEGQGSAGVEVGADQRSGARGKVAAGQRGGARGRTAAGGTEARESSKAIRKILGRQAEKRTAPVLQREIYGKVRLVPEFCIAGGGAGVQFKIGAGRLYVLKNVFEFAQNLMDGSSFAYGKNLEFSHEMEAFDEEGQAMAKFILQWTQTHRNRYENVHVVYPMTRSMHVLPALREIPLDGASLTMFLDAAMGRPIHGQVENQRYVEPYVDQYLNVIRSQPRAKKDVYEGDWQKAEGRPGRRLQIKGGREKKDGLTLTCDYVASVLCPKEYVSFQEGRIYRVPRKEIEPIVEIIRLFDWNPDQPLYVGREDVAGFCKEILPRLEKLYDCEKKNFNEEEWEQDRVQFAFYLDAPGDDRVTCKIYALYGERRYNVFDQQREAGSRDLPEEVRMIHLAGGCFSGKSGLPEEMEGEGRVTGMISIYDDEQIYQLLEEGLRSLHNLGTVFLSDTLRKIQVKPSPKVSVGVSVSGDLLELSMTSKDISNEELVEILSKYNRRKKYYRLKNGDFIRVEDDSVQALADLRETLDLSTSDLAAGAARVPKFRALYLDQQLREKQSVDVERNRAFRSLIRNMKTVEESDFDVPISLKSVLRSYQKTGFLWLKTLSKNGFGGILADDMGLGKTLQVIAYLLSEQEDWQREAAAGRTGDAAATGAAAAASWDSAAVSAANWDSAAVSGSGAAPLAGGTDFATAAGQAPSLIVCPASLVYNWENEIATFAPALKTRVIVGSADQRQRLIEEIQAGEICITSYELLRRDCLEYENIQFACQVLDEAQYIKNHSTKAARSVKLVRAAFKVALTGTPIENRLSELWSIFDYLMPGFLYTYDRFRRELEQPIAQQQDEHATNRLQKMIRPFVLRRLKGDVLKDLPDKIEKNMFTRLTGEQQLLYDANVKQLMMLLEGQSDEEFKTSKIQILSMLTRLRQICCDPALAFEDYRGGSNKTQLCMELLQNGVDGGHQILLFSQFTTMLAGLEEQLQEAGISYFLLTGATPKATRMELVNRFNKGEASVFLISLKAGGTGLNLTAADMVIHFDPWWNLAVQNQATDRAHRIGQEKVVSVYKLIARDTIEENILKLQERKKALADQLLGGEGLSSGSFSREELLELLQ